MSLRKVNSGALASNTAGMEWFNVAGTPTYGSDASGYYTDCVSAGAACNLLQVVNAADTAGKLYVGFRFRFVTSLPGANDLVFRFVTSGNVTVGEVIYLNASQKLRLRNSSSATIGSDSAALVADTDYFFEASIDSTTSPGALEFKLNGTSVASGANDIQGNWQRVRLGNISAPTATMRVRDIYVVDDTAGGPTTYLGAGKAVFQYPNAAGDFNQFLDTTAGAGTTNNYTLVDEQPPNDATDFVQYGLTAIDTVNNQDMYNMTASGINSYDTVVGLQVSARLADITTISAVTAVKLELEKTASGTRTESAAISPNSTTWKTNNSTTTLDPPIIAYLDPDGAAWTQSTLDSMQTGVKCTALGAGRVGMSGIWAYSWVTPGTPPSSGPRKLTILGVG